MGLPDLPHELLIQILEYLPDFTASRTETIGPNIRITPPICRVCRSLRHDGLPLFARTGSFVVQTDGDLQAPTNRLSIWLDALNGEALSKVQLLQLSKHWKLEQPARCQGHVGFYVRLQLLDKSWNCTVGTYPIANDMRCVRYHSVCYLRQAIMERLQARAANGRGRLGLVRSDIEYCDAVMDVIASNPGSGHHMEESAAGRQRRRRFFENIGDQVANARTLYPIIESP